VLSNEQRNWNAMAQGFVADVRGESSEFYPTFEDGWVASKIIDVIRTGKAWADVPNALAQ